jgi:dephospho-CoA kinase
LGTASPPLVGLTGGIGAGKSEALAALERLGAATLSTDAVVHELYDDPEVVAAVVDRWGEQVAPDGVVSRPAVARAAFGGDPAEREWLENQLWPRVRARVADWIAAERAATPAPRALVVEVPLLFEAGQEAMYDATIAVVADEAVRDERARARGHEAVSERTSRQLSQEDKAARATYVVRNERGLEELQFALSDVLDRISAIA